MHDQFTSDGIVLDNAMSYWIHRVYQATRNESFRALRAHGYLSVEERRAIAMQTLRQVVEPCARALLRPQRASQAPESAAPDSTGPDSAPASA